MVLNLRNPLSGYATSNFAGLTTKVQACSIRFAEQVFLNDFRSLIPSLSTADIRG